MFTGVLGRYLASAVLSVLKPFGGADRVDGQLRGEKECPFSGVTKSGRVWRKVPESDAGSVGSPLNQMHRQQLELTDNCYCRDTGGKRTRR